MIKQIKGTPSSPDEDQENAVYTHMFTLRDKMMRINGVEFSNDGQFLYTSSFDCALHIYDIEKGTCIRSLHAFKYGIEGIKILKTKNHICICPTSSSKINPGKPTSVEQNKSNAFSNIRLWDIRENRYHRVYNISDRIYGGCAGISVHPTKSDFIACSIDGIYSYFSMDKETPIWQRKAPTTCPIACFSKQGTFFALYYGSGFIHLYDTVSPNEPFLIFNILHLLTRYHTKALCNIEDVISLQLIENDTLLIVTTQYGRTITLDAFSGVPTCIWQSSISLNPFQKSHTSAVVKPWKYGIIPEYYDSTVLESIHPQRLESKSLGSTAEPMDTSIHPQKENPTSSKEIRDTNDLISPYIPKKMVCEMREIHMLPAYDHHTGYMFHGALDTFVYGFNPQKSSTQYSSDKYANISKSDKYVFDETTQVTQIMTQHPLIYSYPDMNRYAAPYTFIRFGPHHSPPSIINVCDLYPVVAVANINCSLWRLKPK